MIHLSMSNRVEALVSALIGQKNAVSRSALQPTQIIVPNRSMSSYLKFAIAEHAGIATGLHFHFFSEAISKEVKKVAPHFHIITERHRVASCLSAY